MSKKSPSPAAGREEARMLATQMRKEQAAREKRTKVLAMTGFGAAVLALLAAIGVLVVKSQPVPLPEPGALAAPTAVTASGGIPMGAGGSAGTTNPEAPVVDVYLDFMCSWCAVFEDSATKTLAQMRDAGDITLAIHPLGLMDYTTPGGVYSTRAAAAAAWVAEHSPTAFEKFVETLFTKQADVGPKGLSDSEIADVARAAGADEATAAGIADLTSYQTYAAWVAKVSEDASSNTALHNDQGKFGTPTVVIDGTRFPGNWQDQDALSAAVQAAVSAFDTEGHGD